MRQNSKFIATLPGAQKKILIQQNIDICYTVSTYCVLVDYSRKWTKNKTAHPRNPPIKQTYLNHSKTHAERSLLLWRIPPILLMLLDLLLFYAMIKNYIIYILFICLCVCGISKPNQTQSDKPNQKPFICLFVETVYPNQTKPSQQSQQ